MNVRVEWLTIKGAAHWLGVSEQTIRNWIGDGVFPAYQINPRGRVLIKAADVTEVIEKGRIVPRQWRKK